MPRCHSFGLEQTYPDQEAFAQRLRQYEAATERLAAILSVLGYHGEPEHVSLVTRSLTSLLQIERYGGYTLWVELQRYPALVAAYALGICAVAAENYFALAALVSARYRDFNERELIPAITVLHSRSSIIGDAVALLPFPDAARRYASLSDYLFDVIKPLVAEYFLDERGYDGTFDFFEYINSLLYLRADSQGHGGHWAPIGRLVYRYGGPFPRWNWSTSSMALWIAAIRAKGTTHPVFHAGLFDSMEEFEQLVEMEQRIRDKRSSNLM
jgi:hypothetical protein